MNTTFEITAIFPVDAGRLYSCWLNSDEHSKMTGGKAIASESEGGSFSAWDDYITGKNLELIQGKKIRQTWRTTEFGKEDKDSLLEIIFQPVKEGCELKLTHSEIPPGQPDYKQGWIDHYFVPMKRYFSE